IVAAVSLVDIGTLDLAAGKPLSGFDDGAQRGAVIRIAGQRPGMQHELPTRCPRIGGDDGSLHTELVIPRLAVRDLPADRCPTRHIFDLTRILRRGCRHEAGHGESVFVSVGITSYGSLSGILLPGSLSMTARA